VEWLGKSCGRECREAKGDGSPWERIATLALPADAPYQYLKSAEPLAGGKGAFRRSYFTVQAGDDKDADTSMWLFGYEAGGQHLIRRDWPSVPYGVRVSGLLAPREPSRFGLLGRRFTSGSTSPDRPA
jgi:hypothetical protein